MADLVKFALKDAAIGQRVVVLEPMEDEIRWRHFSLREWADGEQPFAKGYVPVLTLRTVQGRPGQKPRYDSGESETASQMPGSAMVVDGILINHDWTEAHKGLMIVKAMGWIGIYINSKLVHRLSPFEQAHRGDEVALAETMAKAFGAALDVDIAIGHATQQWSKGTGVLPDDLTQMRLT